jgi:hypothetical protein
MVFTFLKKCVYIYIFQNTEEFKSKEAKEE